MKQISDRIFKYFVFAYFQEKEMQERKTKEAEVKAAPKRATVAPMQTDYNQDQHYQDSGSKNYFCEVSFDYYTSHSLVRSFY